MKRLLILIDFYLPGYKAGGIIQFISNLSECIKEDYDIYIITSDHDIGEGPYPDIGSDIWIKNYNGISILYLSKHKRTFKNIFQLIKQLSPGFIYLNSMFSVVFTIYPLLASASMKRKHKLILAPNGMLKKPALKNKKYKKAIFLYTFKLFAFHKKITFHACEPVENKNIKDVFGQQVTTKLVNYFPTISNEPIKEVVKKINEVRCLFISRILPHKNLLFLLRLLEDISTQVHLSIVGPIEDKRYWDECLEWIKARPANIQIEYLGSQPHTNLKAIYLQTHLFILPSESESFGQVIFDALLYGKPILISDQTPWRNLEKEQIGWDLPLSEPALFSNAIKEASAWCQVEYNRRSMTCWKYAQTYIASLNLRAEYNALFS